ncbi:hypothetical protein AB4Y45_44615 [Paraburkholderia sp. EG287A]|uniref:hypothetical protein n=1 Tax=unclassified Paraburkholderia TaxID=2615204 RepID=UPI0034D1E455
MTGDLIVVRVLEGFSADSDFNVARQLMTTRLGIVSARRRRAYMAPKFFAGKRARTAAWTRQLMLWNFAEFT